MVQYNKTTQIEWFCCEPYGSKFTPFTGRFKALSELLIP